MTNCLFYSIFFVLFLNTSLGSLRYSQINRTFLSIFKGMLEACVITIDESGEPITPYFNKAKIEDYVVSYLKNNVSRYSNDFSLQAKFYDENFQKENAEYTRGVVIKLNAKITNFFTYEKEQKFSIWSKESL